MGVAHNHSGMATAPNNDLGRHTLVTDPLLSCLTGERHRKHKAVVSQLPLFRQPSIKFHFSLFSFLADHKQMDADLMDEKRKEHIAYEYLCHLEEAKK